jgi:redox-sensitive bicupin YhaK (pirin superfamily)
MKKRTVEMVLPSLIAGGGGRVFIKQPIPRPQVDQVSPFVLLHHFGPIELTPNEESLGFGAHPHRGFMPVTFLFDGAMHHKDSLGNEGTIVSGGVQWLNAASGVIHSETQPQEFKKSGGMIDGIQLWINLPARLKSAAPTYTNLPKDRLPSLSMDGSNIKVVSGVLGDTVGPATPPISIDAFMIEMEAGATLELPARSDWNVMLFNLRGDIIIENEQVNSDELAVFSEDGDTVVINATLKSRLLYLAGEPIDEPMYSYGPFVMNTEAEIGMAYADYKSGRMGKVQ